MGALTSIPRRGAEARKQQPGQRGQPGSSAENAVQQEEASWRVQISVAGHLAGVRGLGQPANHCANLRANPLATAGEVRPRGFPPKPGSALPPTSQQAEGASREGAHGGHVAQDLPQHRAGRSRCASRHITHCSRRDLRGGSAPLRFNHLAAWSPARTAIQPWLLHGGVLVYSQPGHTVDCPLDLVEGVLPDWSSSREGRAKLVKVTRELARFARIQSKSLHIGRNRPYQPIPCQVLIQRPRLDSSPDSLSLHRPDGRNCKSGHPSQPNRIPLHSMPPAR